jgi:hypothetical protein
MNRIHILSEDICKIGRKPSDAELWIVGRTFWTPCIYWTPSRWIPSYKGVNKFVIIAVSMYLMLRATDKWHYNGGICLFLISRTLLSDRVVVGEIMTILHFRTSACRTISPRIARHHLPSPFIIRDDQSSPGIARDRRAWPDIAQHGRASSRIALNYQTSPRVNRHQLALLRTAQPLSASPCIVRHRPTSSGNAPHIAG